MKGFLFIPVSFILVLSCNREDINFSVRGSFKKEHPEKIYLQKLTNSGPLGIDSVDVDENGDFKLKGFTAIPSFFLLSADKSGGIHLVIRPGDNIKIYVNSRNYALDYIVEGSIESARISKLIREQSKTLERITGLSEEYEIIKTLPGFEGNKARLDSTYQVIFKHHKEYSEDFIRENPASFASLMALYQQLGRRAPVFDIKTDLRLFELVDSSLSSAYPSSEPVQSLNSKVVNFREERKFEPGSVAPEISLPDSSGKIVSLTGLKGKILIVGFWASWSSRSKDDLAALKNLYGKYSNRNMNILQVSLDKTKSSWKKAIEDYDLPWLHVSDLNYWNSKAAKTYRVTNLPFYVLVGKDGKIVLYNASLSEIDGKLTELF